MDQRRVGNRLLFPAVMMRKLIILLILITGAIAAGCAPRYEITTNAFLSAAAGVAKIPEGATFSVLENEDAPNLIFDREIKGKIERMLDRSGYRIESREEADYFLTYYYSMDPGEVVSEYVPYYYPSYYDFGFRSRYRHFGYGFGYHGHPGYQVTRRTVYTKRLMLKVVDAGSVRESDREQVIWQGETLSTGSASDLRQAIDYLLVATFKYFGRDTGKCVHVTLPVGDKEVRELRY